MSIKSISQTLASEERGIKEDIVLPCLNCGKPLRYSADGPHARGIFNSFCHDTDCEDEFAARL